jgi:hypothetical protein
MDSSSAFDTYATRLSAQPLNEVVLEIEILRTSQVKNSAKFVVTEFSEVRRKQNLLTRLPLSLLCALGKGTTQSRGFEARSDYGRLRDG